MKARYVFAVLLPMLAAATNFAQTGAAKSSATAAGDASVLGVGEHSRTDCLGSLLLLRTRVEHWRGLFCSTCTCVSREGR
jgi:hypothetical protein